MTVTTRNVNAFRVDMDVFRQFRGRDYILMIDGESFRFVAKGDGMPKLYAFKENGKWGVSGGWEKSPWEVKSGGTSMDDAFVSRFIVVLPDGPGISEKTTKWAAAESAHFLTRWRSLMRGDALVKTASQVMPEDMQTANLILWGDIRSNPLIARMIQKLPVKWTPDIISIDGVTLPTATHTLLMTYPNPLAPQRRIVVNSGLTFRESHDRTNSLQNPKLPDWTVLDVTQPPNAETAGKVVAADFFDTHWQVKPIMTPVDKR
jgi:hypothetical protein